MASHFKIAADAAFTVDVTEFYQDPVGGQYDSRYEWERRGSIHMCLSGVIVQDFGYDMQDRKILISDEYAMRQAQVDALWAKCVQRNREWYFTDGVHVFKVVFWRFTYDPHGSFWFQGLQHNQPPDNKWIWYSYEMTLLVREVVS